jgi:phosphopantothenoylcysteine decarboxylase/phosphopantothenate--cysteine ligase
MALIGLGVSGGIGAYKAVELARLLQKRGHDVQAVMTRAAARFVGPVTFEAITRRPVITSQWKPGANADIEHISIASDIALLVVAPATANIIGKFAAGIADDFLSSLYLASTAPVLLAPAMNTNMLAHPAVQKNLADLASRGVKFVDPGEGYLACGWIGKGRLAEPGMIADAVDRVLSGRRSLAGKRVTVTAGPTFEDLDPVRFVGNRSSGKMGYALAAELSNRGATVTLITGPTSLGVPPVASVANVRSARDMHDAVTAALPQTDVLVMAAAVANYTAGSVAGEKIAHDDGPLTLQLVPTVDILADAAAWRRRSGGHKPLLIGFAAETSQVLERARAKRVRKGIDVIVANDVGQPGAGFEVDTNQVTIVDANGEETLPLQSKAAIASALADRLERWLQAAPAETRA